MVVSPIAKVKFAPYKATSSAKLKQILENPNREKQVCPERRKMYYHA